MATTSPAKRPPAKRPAAKPAARRAPQGPGVVARAMSLVGRGLRGLWLGLAHVLGAAARRFGHSARDLDPAHRRDGIGLGLIGVAVIIAAVTWWGMAGLIGTFVTAVVT